MRFDVFIFRGGLLLFSSLIHPSLAKSPFTLNAEPMLHGPEEE
jgi:hypothetical protein